MASRDIVVVGTSAGGVEALTTLVAALPETLTCSIFVVIHLAPSSPGMLPQILSRAGKLPAVTPRDGEALKPGMIYVAPPDRHMILDGERIRVLFGPKENRNRPAIDPLFRSAAMFFGSRVVGVILTGSLGDGAGGLRMVKEAGGTAIVQDPNDALYPSMPSTAMANLEPDYVLPLADIPAKLVELTNPKNVLPPEHPVRGSLRPKDALLALENDHEPSRNGHPSVFSCPDCGGVLWEVTEENVLRYRCRVGHAFSPETMLEAQGETLEGALWAALATLDESATLARRLAEQHRGRGLPWIAQRFEEREQIARERASLVRQALLGVSLHEIPVAPEEEPVESGGKSGE
ncbi:MAG: chemotaxis protein CheB [Thermoanaerobaculia bacterium]